VADDDATTDDAQGGADGGGDDQGSSSASGTQDGAGTGDQPSAADLKAALDEIRELRRENAKLSNIFAGSRKRSRTITRNLLVPLPCRATW